MELLVFSDSHGDTYNMLRVINAQRDIKNVIFLGDGEYDINLIQKAYPDINIYKVKGNCDRGSSLTGTCVQTFYGKKIMFTHGDEQGVKYSLDRLIYKALESRADIVLYGHTHCPENHYDNGLYVMNPGSIRDGYYGLIDISDSGIMCSNARASDLKQGV